LPTPYAQAIETHGYDTARALWQLTVDNRERLTSAADRLGVALKRTGSLVLATNAKEAALLQNSAQMLASDGFEARFEEKDPLDRGFLAALHYPDDVVVDIVALTKSLLSAQGVPMHTGTEVYGLEQDGDAVLVLARGRAVKASTVVLTVNAYAPLLDGYFADKIAPVPGHIVSTAPFDERLIEMPGSAGPFSFRQASDGRLIFAAWPKQYETPASGPQDKSAEIELMRFVGRHFPEATQRLAHRDSSVMGISRDGLPLIGALPHLPQVFFAVGFAGYGLNLAFAAAELLTGLIVRGAEPPLLSARRFE
jgi:glycine/D-amino acid oxidase-like deaminating enzyme